MFFKSISEISHLIRSRKLSVVELTQGILDRIDSMDSEFHSYVFVDHDGALSVAQKLQAEIERGQWRGPLHGIPVAVKDIYSIAGQPFELGMPSRVGKVAESTATVVTRLEQAGAIVVGRLNLTEGVYSEHIPPFTTPKNPWAKDRWVGSSSSGSGVATAAGLAFGTLASDTGGSIRIPASCNGVTGLKPTWGRCSRSGVWDFAATLDHVGPMARSAIDTGLMLEAIAGYDAADPTSLSAPVPQFSSIRPGGLQGTTIGIDLEWGLQGVTAATQQALFDAIDVFAELGAEIVPIEFPDPTVIIDDWFKVCGVQAAHVTHDWFKDHRESYGGALTELLDLGLSLSAFEYQNLIRRRLEFTGKVKHAIETVDALLIPGLPFEAPLASDMVDMDEQKISDIHRFTVPFTMSQLPTITMPGGFSEEGLPVSVQLVGGSLSEATLVQLGASYQGVTDWHRRTPPC